MGVVNPSDGTQNRLFFHDGKCALLVTVCAIVVRTYKMWRLCRADGHACDDAIQWI